MNFRSLTFGPLAILLMGWFHYLLCRRGRHRAGNGSGADARLCYCEHGYGVTRETQRPRCLAILKN